MEIKQAEFFSSFPGEGSCPKDTIPEFAFIGRSNVGKSSLINMLVKRKGLAKVSATPGKTQLINFFTINEKWYLVDLPGYGYARLSKEKKAELSKMIEGYLFRRTNLVSAFVLIDANVPVQNLDVEFVNMLGSEGVPFALVFTKTDRMSRNELAASLSRFFKKLKETWETPPPHFITSSQYSIGREDILKYIERALKK